MSDPSDEDSQDEPVDLPVIPFSASTGEGRDEILEYLEYFTNNL